MQANPKTQTDQSLIKEIDLLNQEAWDICRDQPGKAIKLAQSAMDRSIEISYELGKAKAYHVIGSGKGWLSEFKEAEEMINLAIQLLNELKETRQMALAYYSMGVLNYYKGDYEKSRLFFNLSYETCVSAGDGEGKMRALNGLGSVYTQLENYKRAWRSLNEANELSKEYKNESINARIAEGMAALSRREGDHLKAIDHCNKALKISKKLGNKNNISTIIAGIGESYLELGDLKKAEANFSESLEIRRETGFKVGEAECHIGLGKVLWKSGKIQDAESSFLQTLDLAASAGGKAVELSALKCLRDLYREKEDWKRYSEFLDKYYRLKQDVSSENSLKEQNVQLEKAFENTKVLSDIGQEIISSLELEKILFTIYNKVNQLMDATVFGIGIYHEKDQKIEYKLAIESGKKYKPYFRDTKDKSQLAVWCIDYKDVVFINDIEKEKKKYTKEEEDIWNADLEDGSQSQDTEQSILYVPIMSGKQIIGLITVQSFEKNAYSEHHLDLLKNIAIYASIALINANVYSSLEERIELTKELQQQHSKLEEAYENNKILSEIAKDITSSLSIPEVINKVYHNINSIMDASVFVIGLYDEKQEKIIFEGTIEKGVEAPVWSNDIHDTTRPAVICFTQKKELIINDRVKDYTRILGIVPKPSRGEVTQSIIYLPLISKKKAIGVISVQSYVTNAYNDYHIDLLRNLSVNIPIALENAMLYKEVEEKVKARTEEIEQSYRNTKLLAEMGRDIASARSVESITELVYERINTLMDASGLGFGIYNKEENRIDFPCDIEKGEKLPFNSDSLEDENRLSAWCFKNQKEVVIGDFYSEYNNYIPNSELPEPSVGEQSCSIIYVPLTIKKERIGVFTVQSFESNAYNDYHMDIVRNLSVPISTAIENALLYESLEEQVRERTREVTLQHEQLQQSYKNTRILNEIGQDITASLSIKEVIQKVYKNINTLMDAAVFSIALYSKNKGALIFEGGMENDDELPYYEVSLDDEDRLAVNCFVNRREIIINEVDDVKKYVKKNLPPRVGDVMESVIYLPLVSKDKTLGVFTVQSPNKYAYSEYHIDLLRNLAVYTPIALDNALMYSRMEKEVERRTEEIQKSYQNTKMLSEIGLDIISAISIEEIAEIVYEKANILMDATSIALGLFNEKRNRIDFVSEFENGEKQPFSFVSLEDENKLSTVCFKSQKEIVINDFDTEYSNYIKEWYAAKTEDSQATQAIIYIPLTLKDKRIGVFTVQSFKKNVYSAYDLDILKNLGVAISTAVENATLYESLEEKVKERTDELVKEKEKAEFEREEAKYQRRRAEKSEQFKQQFLANMSHEIRTPMNAIMGMTNLLLEKKSMPEEANSYLNSVKKSSESLLVIINDILDLSKIEAGKMELEKVDFSLEEILRLVEQTIAYRADEKALVLSVIYDDEIPPVLVGDPVRLQQVLMNMAGNAVKFTEKGGVTISAYAEGGNLGNQCKIHFEVRDTGIGLSPEQQSKIFESFSQASADTTRKYGGTGLGLSISSKLVELFGSSIKLDSVVGEGSVFSFDIVFPVSENKQAVNKESEIPTDFLAELKGVRILLAEDNEYNQVVATETLELKIPDVKVTIANNGEEAFHAIRDHGDDYDLVLMDVQMPVMDGFDATRNIRKLPGPKGKIPIIALTASVIKKDIQMCLDAGMIGFVPKPFKTSELIEAIYKGLKREGNESEILTNTQEQMDTNGKVTSLDFLRDFTEGDEERIKKYVGMYLDSSTKNVPQLQKLLEEEKWDELKVLVHSMKPHFDFMGMKETRAMAENIEAVLIEKKDLDTIPEKMATLISVIEKSISELKS